MTRKISFWHKFGCFLTGYNCQLLRQCSEASFKKLTKYTSALLIIMLIWGAVGYLFAREYLKLEKIPAVLGGLVAVVLIVLIERQIILSVGKNRWGKIFRILLGMIMAVLGATIIDQILFQEDIEKEKLEFIQQEVNRIVPQRTQELRKQIASLDSVIQKKENEKIKLAEELNRRKTIAIPHFREERDSTGKIINKTVTTQYVINPKFKTFENLQTNLDSLMSRKKEMELRLLKVRDETENELKNRKGFLNELLILYRVISKSWLTILIYLMIFSFFLFIELIVLMIKSSDDESDYDVLVREQQNVRKRQFLRESQ